MSRMRRSSEQTLEYKIEQAEAKVGKTGLRKALGSDPIKKK